MKGKEIVTHHNYLNESILNLSELELNLFVIILYKMRNKSERTVLFEAKEIKSIVGSKDRSYKAFEKLTHSLQDRTIYLKTLDGYDRIKPFPLLSFNIKKNTVKIKIDDSLEPLIKNLTEQFTRYSLQEFLSLKSKHSKRLFQLLKQYENIGKRSINLNQLKDYLDCNTKSYERMFNFEKKVLSVARKEINDKTSMEISYEKFRVGRTITSIDFYIKSTGKNMKSEIIEAKIVENNIDKAIKRAKENKYVSKVWNKRVDTKMLKINKELGEDYTLKLLDRLFFEVKEEITTTLVQYINSMIDSQSSEKKKRVEGTSGTKTRVFTMKIREEEIEKAIDKCIEVEGMKKKFLMDLRKSSEKAFMSIIKNYM